MFLRLIQMVVPALIIVVTLFGLLARGNPKPGGVALFGRVGFVCLLLGGIAWYVVDQLGVLGAKPLPVVDGYRGLVGGGVLMVLFAAFGSMLKERR